MSVTVDPFAQTRRPNGVVPCLRVEPAATGGTGALRFSPAPPGSVALGSPADTGAAPRPSMALLDLATCVAVRRDPATGEAAIEVYDERLLEFARSHGPLFARAPLAHPAGGGPLGPDAPFDEARSLWASAAIVANLAVVAQECANGALPLAGAESALGNLVHLRVRGAGDWDGLDLYSVSRPTSADYATWTDAPLFVRREQEPQTGRLHYGFVLPGAEGGLDTVIASFDHEITALDWHLLLRALELDAAGAERVRDQLVAAGHDVAGAAGELSGELASEAVPLGTGDLGALGALVRTLVAAHLRDARIDVFATGGETGYFTFGSLLSWLWYDFSHDLASVRVKYCARCGRGFSVAGHRGPERNYCSAACRNAAHNRRSSARRDDIRAGFLERGASVDELAHAHFPDLGEKDGRDAVRATLSSWPALKHAVDEAIDADGWGAPLLRRCAEQGLDLLRLLPARRRSQLRAMRGRDAR